MNFMANAAHADLLCKDVLRTDDFAHTVFKGYLQNSQKISKILGYPQNWTYRLIAGRFTENKDLVGSTASTYLHLGGFLFESPYFRVPEVERSTVNLRVLELEYFEDQRFDEFLKLNKYNSNTFKLVKQCNPNVAHLFSTLEYEVFKLNTKVSVEKIKPMIWGSIEDIFIRIVPPNVLTV